MSCDTDSGGMTQEDILADLRDELGLPYLCLTHPNEKMVEAFFRRGSVQFASYSCGCHYDAAKGRFVEPPGD